MRAGPRISPRKVSSASAGICEKDRLLDNPKAWLFTVANNLAVDTNRNERNVRILMKHVGGD